VKSLVGQVANQVANLRRIVNPPAATGGAPAPGCNRDLRFRQRVRERADHRAAELAFDVFGNKAGIGPGNLLN